MNRNVSGKTSAQMVQVSKDFLRRMEREMSLASLVIANLRTENEKLENQVRGLAGKADRLKEKVCKIESEIEKFKDNELLEGICRAQDCLRGEIQAEDGRFGGGNGNGNGNGPEGCEMEELRELGREFVRNAQEVSGRLGVDGKENNEHSSFLNFMNSNNFIKATHYLLTFILHTPKTPLRTQQTEASSDTSSECYSEVLKNSKVLLKTLMTQKSRLEHLNLHISKRPQRNFSSHLN